MHPSASGKLRQIKVFNRTWNIPVIVKDISGTSVRERPVSACINSKRSARMRKSTNLREAVCVGGITQSDRSLQPIEPATCTISKTPASKNLASRVSADKCLPHPVAQLFNASRCTYTRRHMMRARACVPYVCASKRAAGRFICDYAHVKALNQPVALFALPHTFASWL